MEVAAQVAGGALLGWAIDAIFGTTWGLLAGSITGLVVGLWTLVKNSLKLNKQLEAMGPRPRAQTLVPSEPQAPLTGEQAAAADAATDEMEMPSWREEWDEWKTGEASDGDAGEQQD